MIRGVLLVLSVLVGPAFAQDHPALSDASAALARGDRNTAGNALVDVIATPRQADAHPHAWAMLGRILASAELPEAALVAFAEAAADPEAFAPVALSAVALAETTGDDAVLGEALAGVGATSPIADLPPTTPGVPEAMVHAARAAIHAGEFAKADAIAARVPGASPVAVEARVLRATALANQEKYGEALAQLLIADAAVDPDDTELADLVKLQLARVYYASDNPLQAIQHYVQVSRQGPLWRHAQWERAWAHFRVDDLQGSLSLLYAWKTPFLEHEYLAEGDMLRIYSLFLLCKFPSAKEELDRFQERYPPLLATLDQRTDGMTPADAWADAALWSTGLPTTLPPEVWQHFEADDRLEDARTAATAASDELTRLRGLGHPWSDLAAERLEARRDAIIEAEGARILARATAMRDELRTMLEGADLTRLDILDYERRLLERAAITGEIDLGDRIGELRALRRRRTTRLWPNSTEYWADEVGYHSVRTRSDCREDLL